jgi:hypothetical protein
VVRTKCGGGGSKREGGGGGGGGKGGDAKSVPSEGWVGRHYTVGFQVTGSAKEEVERVNIDCAMG